MGISSSLPIAGPIPARTHDVERTPICFMSRLKLPLYSKILLWFLVNLGVVVGIVFFYVRVNFGSGFDWLVSERAGTRIELLDSYMQSVLVEHPETEWPKIVENFGHYLEQPLPAWETVLKSKHLGDEVSFAMFLPSGEQVLGRRVEVPPEVLRRLIDKRLPEGRPRAGRPDQSGEAAMKPPKPRFVIRSEHPTRYWTGIHSSVSIQRERRWYPLTFVIIAADMTAGGLLFDWWPWVVVLAIGIGISALLWIPVVGGITRAIRRTNEASKRIAAGQFDVRLQDQRSDELGELATSVNTMAAHLGDYMAQQRRITADVAHELCSPIARMQMALGVVEQRSIPEQAAYLKKLDTELQHMAGLVEEILAFSKANSLPERESASDIELIPFINVIIAREAPDADIVIDVPKGLHLHTLRDALDRAVANVLRNAVRYAGTAGPIQLRVAQNPNVTLIQIADQGPGVPEDALPRLFEPFFRPEAARGRHTGGSGLGLAIVKRCIEACGGSVSAELREPQGLIISLNLPTN